MTVITDNGFARISKETLILDPTNSRALTGDSIAYNETLTINEKISTITGEDLTASSVANVPSGNLVATNVQGALNELDNEKAKLVGDNNFTGYEYVYGTVEVDSATNGSVFITEGSVDVKDQVYGAGWNGNTTVPTKNAVYDIVETKANDSAVVHLTGNETATGNKTFLGDTSLGSYDSSNTRVGGTSYDLGGAGGIEKAFQAGVWNGDGSFSPYVTMQRNGNFGIGTTSPVEKLTVAGNILGGLLAPEGFLINGKIVPSVASGNLTVALKTLAGTDASASNPIYVMIGGVMRSITGALSTVITPGNNFCNSGSAELASKEIDYFTYLGFNATDGVVLGFARFGSANMYSDFNNADASNEKFLLVSNRTNAVSSDSYINIGRFAATLSAGAGYTWSVPTYTASNLIQRPIYETRWLSIAPTLTWTGTTAPSGVPIVKYKYKVSGDSVIIDYIAYSFTPGVAITALVATLPFNASAGIWKHTTQVSTINDLNLTGGYIITDSLNAFCAPVSAERVWASATYEI